MYASKPHVVVVRLCVGLNIRVSSSKREGVHTPLLPFLGPNDELDVASPILH